MGNIGSQVTTNIQSSGAFTGLDTLYGTPTGTAPTGNVTGGNVFAKASV